MRSVTHLALVFAAVLAVAGVVRLTGNADGRAAAPGHSSTPRSLTPPAFAGPEGVWWSNPVDAPGLQLNLGRLALSPGDVASDSSLSGAVIYVESGTLAFVVQSGTVYLGPPAERRADPATPEGSPAAAPPAWPTPLPLGVQIPLQPGDTIFHDGTAEYGFVNAGEMEAVVWRSKLDVPGSGSCAGGRC
jgi:hypothetical protein